MLVGIRILVSTVQCGDAIPVYKNMIWGTLGPQSFQLEPVKMAH